MPTADMQKDKTVMLGGNVLDKHPLSTYWNNKNYTYTYNYYINVTIFPWLEVAYTCTLVKGVKGNYWPEQTWGKFRNQDRNFSGRLRLWKEGWWKEWTPQLVLGANDPGSFDNNGASWSKTGTGTFGNDNGNYYGKLSSNSNNAAVYQVVSFKKNTDYVVKGKVKISNAKGQVFLAVKNGQLSAGLKDNNGKKIETTISSSEDKAGQYQDVEFTFNSGDNTSGSIAFIKWTERNGNQDIIDEEVWIDDVSVKAVSDASEDDQYEMVWADDFNENQLDTSNWDYELGSIRGVEQEHYVNDPENVYVKDGQLVLQVTNRDKEDQYKNPRGNRQVIYNSGSIRTHGK